MKPKLNSRLLPMSNDMKILTAEYTRTCGYLLYDFLNVFEQVGEDAMEVLIRDGFIKVLKYI